MINLFHRRTTGRSDSRPSYPTLPKDRVVYAIGDIHGRSDLLDHVHAAIDAAERRAGKEITEVSIWETTSIAAPIPKASSNA